MQIILPLPEALVSEIRWLSAQDGCPEAEIIHEALGAYLARRRIAHLQMTGAASNQPFSVSDDDQYLADLAEPYR